MAPRFCSSTIARTWSAIACIERLMYSSGFFVRNAMASANEISLHHFRKDVGAVANQTDRGRALCLSRLVDQLQCLIERLHHVVAIAGRKPFLDPRRIHLNPDEACAIHGRGQRLRAAHSTEPAADDEFTREISIEMFFPGRAKGFERALHNSLAA